MANNFTTVYPPVVPNPNAAIKIINHFIHDDPTEICEKMSFVVFKYGPHFL